MASFGYYALLSLGRCAFWIIPPMQALGCSFFLARNKTTSLQIYALIHPILDGHMLSFVVWCLKTTSHSWIHTTFQL
jgi:glucose dehydrogenase